MNNIKIKCLGGPLNNKFVTIDSDRPYIEVYTANEVHYKFVKDFDNESLQKQYTLKRYKKYTFFRRRKRDYVSVMIFEEEQEGILKQLLREIHLCENDNI